MMKTMERLFLDSRPRTDLQIRRVAKKLRKRIAADIGELTPAQEAVLNMAMSDWVEAVRCSCEAAKLAAGNPVGKDAVRYRQLVEARNEAKESFARTITWLTREAPADHGGFEHRRGRMFLGEARP
jgi:hypothetical protein